MSSNYPDGVSATTPGAPWNEPDCEREYALAVRHVCGIDIELTTETLTEFLADVGEKREPLLIKGSILRGPCSTGELLTLMLEQKTSDAYIAAAAREFSARYVADAYTQRVIDNRIDQIAEVGV
jgi:hypothetical protein